MSIGIKHNYNSTRGRHYVTFAGSMHFSVDFEARKYADLYLRINGVLVARQGYMGNLDRKIEIARELIERCRSDAPFLQELVDRAIMRNTGKSSELRRQADTCDKTADKLRALID